MAATIVIILPAPTLHVHPSKLSKGKSWSLEREVVQAGQPQSPLHAGRGAGALTMGSRAQPPPASTARGG